MKLFNLKKFKITHKGLYWGLIITFALLYLCVGFVSTLHSITFFGLANSIGLAILLGLTYEVGQASVLFSILMTRNKDKFLPWALMFLLTALQVTANVYASFKFMANSGSNDWTYWQKSILFGVQAANPEMYQVIISWIAGALLPVVALGMTALVAQNIKLMTEEDEEKPKDVVEEFLNHEFKNPEEIKLEKSEPLKSEFTAENPEAMPSREEQLEKFKEKVLSNTGKQTKLEENPIIGEGGVEIIKPEYQTSLSGPKSVDSEGNIWTAGEHPKVAFKPPISELPIDKLDEIVENEVKRRIQEIEDSKKSAELEKEIQETKDDLDEDVERLIPEVNLQLETKEVKSEITQIPVDIVPEQGEPINITDPEILKEAEKAAIREITLETQTKEIKPALFKTNAEGKLEQTPLTKTRGWHLKKEYVDSNGDVYHFGKFSPQEKRNKPEESKKA
jgi:hypothetical protein